MSPSRPTTPRAGASLIRRARRRASAARYFILRFAGARICFTAKYSSSETAEGGGAWRAGCAVGLAGSSQRDTRSSPGAVLYSAFVLRLVAIVKASRTRDIFCARRAR